MNNLVEKRIKIAMGVALMATIVYSLSSASCPTKAFPCMVSTYSDATTVTVIAPQVAIVVIAVGMIIPFTQKFKNPPSHRGIWSITVLASALLSSLALLYSHAFSLGEVNELRHSILLWVSVILVVPIVVGLRHLNRPGSGGTIHA